MKNLILVRRSLARFARSRFARSRFACSFTKGKILNITVLCFLATNAANAQKPDYGQLAIDGMVKGVLMPFTHGNDAAKNVNKSIEKQLFNPEGNGKIETKDGSVKIDTKDPKSLKLADEFRRNYKKSPECLEPANEEISIKCANDYIKARKSALNQ